MLGAVPKPLILVYFYALGHIPERESLRQKEPGVLGSLWEEVVGDDLLARQESTNKF